MPDVSPTKWHRAHTTWFFETFVLSPELAGYRSPDPAYAYLFNSYYEQVGSRHPRSERGLISRPTVAEVGDYRRHVDGAMEEIIATATDDAFDRLSANHRGRLSPRAAAPGAVAHGHQARALVQSARPAYAVTPPAPAPATRTARSPISASSNSRVGSSRSVTTATDSRSTTRRRVTRCCSSRTASRTGSSPPASGGRSSTTAATAAPSCGCPTAGPRCSRRGGTRRCTGSATTAGASSPSKAAGRVALRARRAT